MSDPRPTKRVHPAILQRARELRREMTPQERKLWRCLRGKKLYGIKFRRQHPVDRSILDFFCYAHNLAVEIDGHSHYQPDQRAYDQARTEQLARHGIRVIRFTNRDVETNIEGVLNEIAWACGVGDELPPSNSPQGGENQPPPNGGRTNRPPRGGENQRSPNGGRTNRPPRGGENQPPPKGGRTNRPPRGGEPPPPRGGEPTSPPLGGIEGGKEQP
jgi:very-short-patch-repair endonuclease